MVPWNALTFLKKGAAYVFWIQYIFLIVFRDILNKDMLLAPSFKHTHTNELHDS